VNGIRYNVIDKNKRWVEVAPKESGYAGYVVIPRSVTRSGVKYTVKRIGDSAFECCLELKSLTIPSTVTSIGGDICVQCESLVSIKVEAGNPVYDSRNNCNAIIETKTNTLIQGCQSTVIPEGVTSIKENAFWGCENLESITIPSSVTSIGEEAFWGCTNLASITISEGVTSIGEKAFASCANLKSIIIPSSVREIDYLTFGYCENLESITLPRHITNVDELDLPEGCRIIWR
jgi:hypothetical protein